MRKISAAIVAAGLSAGLLAGCASSTPPIVSHGSVELMSSSMGVLPDSQQITDGDQVIITDPSGKVLTTGTLSYETGMITLGAEIFTFTVTVPAGESRYGIQVSGAPGTVWATAAEMKKGPGLLVQES